MAVWRGGGGNVNQYAGNMTWSIKLPLCHRSVVPKSDGHGYLNATGTAEAYSLRKDNVSFDSDALVQKQHHFVERNSFRTKATKFENNSPFRASRLGRHLCQREPIKGSSSFSQYNLLGALCHRFRNFIVVDTTHWSTAPTLSLSVSHKWITTCDLGSLP